MSAQLTLTDAEMTALLKAMSQSPRSALELPERNALSSAKRKLEKGLDRPSRRNR